MHSGQVWTCVREGGRLVGHCGRCCQVETIDLTVPTTSVVREVESICNHLVYFLTGFSLSQPQPDSASASPCAQISYLECFHVCFFCLVSLIKTIINYCYWQIGWVLFYSRNIHINALAEAGPDILGILWFSLSQNMKCPYFLNETIFSQIASINSELWS